MCIIFTWLTFLFVQFVKNFTDRGGYFNIEKEYLLRELSQNFYTFWLITYSYNTSTLNIHVIRKLWEGRSIKARSWHKNTWSWALARSNIFFSKQEQNMDVKLLQKFTINIKDLVTIQVENKFRNNVTQVFLYSVL